MKTSIWCENHTVCVVVMSYIIWRQSSHHCPVKEYHYSHFYLWEYRLEANDLPSSRGRQTAKPWFQLLLPPLHCFFSKSSHLIDLHVEVKYVFINERHDIRFAWTQKNVDTLKMVKLENFFLKFLVRVLYSLVIANCRAQRDLYPSFLSSPLIFF